MPIAKPKINHTSDLIQGAKRAKTRKTDVKKIPLNMDDTNAVLVALGLDKLFTTNGKSTQHFVKSDFLSAASIARLTNTDSKIIEKTMSYLHKNNTQCTHNGQYYPVIIAERNVHNSSNLRVHPLGMLIFIKKLSAQIKQEQMQTVQIVKDKKIIKGR